MMAMSQKDIFPEIIPRAVAHGFALALKHATAYVGATAPNPPVGCTILDAQDRPIAVAAHRRCGAPHAEQLALGRLREEGRLSHAHTAIVTLEPCNHRGRTPSCAAALLETNIKRIFIGVGDPNPHVKGGGAYTLRQNGRDVIWLAPNNVDGGYYQQCRALIAPFVKAQRTGQPWITVKQAVQKQEDQVTMLPQAGKKTFTKPPSLDFAHHLRRMTDGIITTSATIRADRPSFTVRRCQDHPHRKRELVIMTKDGDIDEAWLKRQQENFKISFCRNIDQLLTTCRQCHGQWFLVEAGPSFLSMLRNNHFWDDWLTVFHKTGCEDRWHVATSHDVSPISLLPQWYQCVKEQICFREL